ncbi:hypothetical protein L249_7272, partial [Ophiocordyceps polyrhachis-furcata BCC 54312]
TPEPARRREASIAFADRSTVFVPSRKAPNPAYSNSAKTRCKDIRTFSRKKGEFSAFLTNLKDKIRTNKATFRDKENRIGFLFRSLDSKAYKTLETYLLTKTKDDNLSYKDFCGYVKDSVYYRKRDAV